MAAPYICELVNIVDNNFTADSRNKDGRRVVSYDPRRSQVLYLFTAHILQIEAAADATTAEDRGVITMSSGLRYISARGAKLICGDMDRLGT